MAATDFPANVAPGAFIGAAQDYLAYRPPYPPAMLQDLLDRAGGGRRAVLVDLACGPGRVALDLAHAFERVVAVDVEPEMIAVGRREAARRGIGNIDWRVGEAEALDVTPGSADLITVGEAFHRLDQAVVAQKALAWLRPGGALATLGFDGLLAGREPWQAAVAAIARAWMARAFPEGWAQGRPGAEVGPGASERVLAAHGFVAVESRHFETPWRWSSEAVVGYLRSLSVCSRAVLGDLSAPFEAEVLAALADRADGPPFLEDMAGGYTLGRGPG